MIQDGMRRVGPGKRRLMLSLLLAGALGATLAIADPGAHSAALERAAAADRPNVVVIETDDQTLESMKVMQNVNSLIGAQGATFANSFVNYSLCCPSRATFLTGQYAHNHGVLEQHSPGRRLRPLRGAARAQQPRRLAAATPATTRP